MKNTRLLLTALIVTSLSYAASAQGWCQDKGRVYSIGIGGTQAFTFGGPYRYPLIYGAGGSLNFSGEYKVHRFVGVGFQTGINAFFGPPYRVGRPDGYGRYGAIGIPIIVKVNVHILEAANVSVANKLDVYAGINAGGGPAFYAYPAGGGVFGFVQAGPQIGIRGWLSNDIGLFAEFGWGATFVNFGLSF